MVTLNHNVLNISMVTQKIIYKQSNHIGARTNYKQDNQTSFPIGIRTDIGQDITLLTRSLK